MKKIILMATLVVISFSCNKDDDTSDSVGTWKLTGFISETGVDINNDGDATTNFITESGCYNNSNLILNSNNTASISLEELELELSIVAGTTNDYEFSTNCLPAETSNGTWSEAGNNISVTFDGETEVLVRNGNTITLVIPEYTEVPETSNGVISYTYEGATLVFTKQ